MDFRPKHALFQSVYAVLTRVEQNQEKIMSAQDDVNSAAAAIQAAAENLTAAAAGIQAELARLNGQATDTSGLNAAVTALRQAQASVDALAPVPSGDGTDDGSGNPPAA